MMTVERAMAHLPGRLAGLKRRGGGVLVVGTGGHDALCRRFRGDAATERRVVTLSPENCGPGRERRRRAVGGTAAGKDEGPATLRLSRLGHDVLGRIDTLADRGLDTAELRVCIDTLDWLVEAAGLDRAALLLDAILERTRAADGLAHAHTAATYRNDTVRRLEPLFDAVVEVAADPAPRQRWHFPADGPETGWLPVRD
jgi:hypothetical protein